MVDAVWQWLCTAAAGGGEEADAAPAAAAARRAVQAQVACARIGFALAERSFGQVKIMHAAPACFDGAAPTAASTTCSCSFRAVW